MMKQKLIAMILVLALAVSLAACGGGEETTVSGMVVSVEGSVISLVEMSGDMEFEAGERPEMPEGMEGFQGFGDFNPEDFEGTMPEAFNGTFPQGEAPQWGDGEMPEGMTPPEGMTMPADGEMPDFGNGGMFAGFASDAETTQLDLGDAHISMEVDGVKTSGTLDDIRMGTFVTVTVNAKGQVTNVLISEMSFPFGGRRGEN